MSSSASRSIVRKIATVVMALGLVASCARAVDVPATAPAGDPFIKKNTPAPSPIGPPANLIFTVETYEVDPADAAKVQQETDTDDARFRTVLDLQKAGKARLGAILCAACVSGDQANVNQVATLPFAAKYDASGAPTPDANYKRKNLGYRFVYKGITLLDGKSYDGICFFPYLRLVSRLHPGFNGAMAQPLIVATDLGQHLSLQFGRMKFLGTPTLIPQETTTTPDQAGTTLAFGKIDQVPIAPAASVADRNAALTNEFSIYSMETDKAVQLLNAPQTAGSAYQAVQALVKSREAKLERLSLITTNPGVKVGINDGTEMIYPLAPGSKDRTSTDIGFQAELTPQFLSDGSTLHLKNVFTHWTRYLGAAPVLGPNNTLPIFGETEVTTSIDAALGEYEFLGTFSPPTGTGLEVVKPDHRVWLEFVRTTAANP